MKAPACGASAIHDTRTASAEASAVRHPITSADDDRRCLFAAGDVQQIAAARQVLRQLHRRAAMSNDRDAASVRSAMAGEAPAKPRLARDQLDPADDFDLAALLLHLALHLGVTP